MKVAAPILGSQGEAIQGRNTGCAELRKTIHHHPIPHTTRLATFEFVLIVVKQHVERGQ